MAKHTKPTAVTCHMGRGQHTSGRATQFALGNRVNQQRRWDTGFVVIRWYPFWFLEKEVIGMFEKFCRLAEN